MHIYLLSSRYNSKSCRYSLSKASRSTSSCSSLTLWVLLIVSVLIFSCSVTSCARNWSRLTACSFKVAWKRSTSYANFWDFFCRSSSWFWMSDSSRLFFAFCTSKVSFSFSSSCCSSLSFSSRSYRWFTRSSYFPLERPYTPPTKPPSRGFVEHPAHPKINRMTIPRLDLTGFRRVSFTISS